MKKLLNDGFWIHSEKGKNAYVFKHVTEQIESFQSNEHKIHLVYKKLNTNILPT